MIDSAVLTRGASTLSEKLRQLRLEARDPRQAASLDALMLTLGDVLCSGPDLISSMIDTEAEAAWWDVFADVFVLEVRAQLLSARVPDLDTDQKRQILADVLVWAEVTQEHYDQDTARFVTAPHMQDESFQRIGLLLQQVKSEKGLTAQLLAAASPPPPMPSTSIFQHYHASAAAPAYSGPSALSAGTNTATTAPATAVQPVLSSAGPTSSFASATVSDSASAATSSPYEACSSGQGLLSHALANYSGMSAPPSAVQIGTGAAAAGCSSHCIGQEGLELEPTAASSSGSSSRRSSGERASSGAPLAGLRQ